MVQNLNEYQQIATDLILLSFFHNNFTPPTTESQAHWQRSCKLLQNQLIINFKNKMKNFEKN